MQCGSVVSRLSFDDPSVNLVVRSLRDVSVPFARRLLMPDLNHWASSRGFLKTAPGTENERCASESNLRDGSGLVRSGSKGRRDRATMGRMVRGFGVRSKYVPLATAGSGRRDQHLEERCLAWGPASVSATFHSGTSASRRAC